MSMPAPGAPAPAPAPTPGGDTTPQAPPAPPDFKAPADQAELDRIIESRLARERQKLAGEYGGDAATVKARLAEYEKYQESQKTEQQKLIDAAKGEASTEVTQKFLKRIVHAEVKSVAASLGFNDPADALAAISGDLPVKDDEPDTDAIKAAVEKLATDKPYLLKTDGTPKRPATRPKPAEGDKPAGTHEGKGRAAAALRQLGAARKTG